MIARKRGCDGLPAPSPVERELYNGKLYIYWNCPSMFIPSSIVKWYKIYKFCKDFPNSMPQYNDVSAKFIQAYELYELFIKEYENELAKLRKGKR